MPKAIPAKNYARAQELWMKTNASLSNIARLCEIPRQTLNAWQNKWIKLGLERPVDKPERRAIDKLLKEDYN